MKFGAMNELIFSSNNKYLCSFSILSHGPFLSFIRHSFFSASKIHSAKSAHVRQKMKMEPSFQ